MNAFTVDLEEWFCVGNMEHFFPSSSWEKQELRLKRPAEFLLELLKRHEVRATFFVLGWAAERHPELVRKIYDAGHEIGLHGYFHRRVTSMTRAEFEDDLRRSFDAVCARGAKIPREAVAGYRAPSFSIVEKTAWALQSLASFGLKYDSSIVPFSGHPDYGWADSPAGIHRPGFAPALVEVPMTPGLGGGYFRLLPYPATRWIIKRTNGRETQESARASGRPAIFYLHPWELDTEQPKIPLPLLKRFRHYVGLSRTVQRLEKLLSEFRFGTIREVLNENGF